MRTKLFLFFALLIVPLTTVVAQSELPMIAPSATYTDAEGNRQTETAITESAPLTVTFEANSVNTDGWTAHYEWHFYKEGQREKPYLIRYEENTEYTFVDAGMHLVECWVIFTQGTDSVTYTEQYWTTEGAPLTVSISESKLDMPNAFSPNGDGINDIYKAKDGYQSLVEFQATIFNRWGQKLYSWNDPAGGWDGKFNGKDVKQGVYFVLVKAKGADGRQFNIRRDVNLLRGYTESTTVNP